MIVIVVMSILFGIAIPSFQTWRERNALRAATETLLAHLKQARHLAATGNRDVVVTINTTASPNYYVVDDGCTQNGVDCQTVKTVKLDQYSTYLTFGPSTNVSSLTFKSASWMSGGTVSIRSSKLETERVIVVNSVGRAYLQ